MICLPAGQVTYDPSNSEWNAVVKEEVLWWLRADVSSIEKWVY